MNRLEDLISSAFEEDARHAPDAGPVVTRVLGAEAPRRRPARRGWLAATAAAAAAAMIVAVGATRTGGDGDVGLDPALTAEPPVPMVPGLTGSGGFAEHEVSYAAESVIHHGDQTINVSPHRVVDYVQTDDGFVFLSLDAQRFSPYFTDGTAVSRIGRNIASDGLRADDSGSYVGWVQGNGTAVVYDTTRGQVVARKQVDDYSAEIVAIDGDTVYVQTGSRPYQVDAWDLTGGTSTSIQQPKRGYVLSDAVNGYRVWIDTNAGGGTIVNRGPGVDQHQYPWQPWSGDALSPDGSYVATPSEETHQIRDRATGRSVFPDGFDGEFVQWLDRDRFVYDRVGSGGDDDENYSHELLTCSVSGGTCSVAVELAGAVLHPSKKFLATY